MSRRRLAGIAAAVLAAGLLAQAGPARAAGFTLTVHSIPRLQGLDFAFDGHRYTTSKNGVVTIPVAQRGTYRLVALPWRHRDRGIRVEFSRWSDENFTAARTVTVNGSMTLQSGYEVSYLRGLAFYDCVRADNADMRTGCEEDETRPVSPERVSTVTLSNIIGQKLLVRSGERRWLVGSRVARRLNGLEETLITYSVMHARVAGSDVVNQAQQSFYLALPSGKHRRQAMVALRNKHYAPKNFLIRLSLYDAHFSTHDLLLRTPVGNALELTYPNGRKRDVPLVDGQAQLVSMPRGLYDVKVKTGAGIPMNVPVSLSKNQDMQLKVISYADVGGSFLIFALISLLLVTARRPALRAAIARPFSGLRRKGRE